MDARQRFYQVVSAAVNDFVEHGFDSQHRLERWLEEIRRAALAALIPEHELVEFLRQSLGRTFRAATTDAALLRKHRGLPPFTLERIRPALRPELDRRILASANLIRLNRDASVQRTLQRFSGWATSIQIGGSDIVKRRETAEHVRRSIAGLPLEERRVIIDQGHKLSAAVNDIVAQDGGAIAMIWHHIHPGAHYKSRPEHLARNGKIFPIRDSWAHQAGLIRPAGRKYLDEIDQPGELIFCSCSGVYLYTPAELPPDMWTAKGRQMVLKVSYVNVRKQDRAALAG
ncbi:MAG: hypothetical protein WBW93_01485 [Steroidobacteraceae bacterium]